MVVAPVRWIAPRLSVARGVFCAAAAQKRRVGSSSKGRKARKMGSTGLTIAVEGCCHGELDTIYATLKLLEQKENKKIDLLICCGDFQAVRNASDLECMAVPQKYRRMMSFYKYYKGEAVAPYPTLFIGGNHEAINHLRELYYGGWVAPNIYFLGYSGVVNFGGVRIGGLSGIFNDRHYKMGHFERLPYTESTKRSAYHVRELDVFRLKQIKEPLDVFLSHDWPVDITDWGDKGQLLHKKPFFRKEVEERRLGSPVASELLHLLKPRFWFSAHLHVKFPALVKHEGGGLKSTKFLALDKCLPRRDFLQVLSFPKARGPKAFQYDAEWLAILKGTHDVMNLSRDTKPLPRDRTCPSEEYLEFAKQTLREKGHKVPLNFEPTVPLFSPRRGARASGPMPNRDLQNPQTVQFLEMMQLPYNLQYGTQERQTTRATEDETPIPGVSDWVHEDEVDSGAEDEDADREAARVQPVSNPEEIDLDSSEEEEGAADQTLLDHVSKRV